MQATHEKITRKINIKKTGRAGIEKELLAFEKKYNMSTESFLKKVELGELDECADFIDWLGAAEQYALIGRVKRGDI